MSIYGFYSWNHETTSTALHCCTCSWAMQLLVVDGGRKSEQSWNKVMVNQSKCLWQCNRQRICLQALKKTSWTTENCCFCSSRALTSLILECCFDVFILAFDQFATDFSMGLEPDAVAVIVSTSWSGRSSERPSCRSSSSTEQAWFFLNVGSSFTDANANSIPKKGSTASSALVVAGESAVQALIVAFKSVGTCELISK